MIANKIEDLSSNPQRGELRHRDTVVHACKSCCEEAETSPEALRPCSQEQQRDCALNKMEAVD